MYNKYFYYINTLLIVFASCSQNKEAEKRANPFAPKVVEAKGYIVPQDSIIEPEVIIIDESKLKRVSVGKPTIVPINTNIHIAGMPKIILAGTPRVCVPGQDTFLLPKKILAKDSAFIAGIPEIIIPKEAILKIDNSQNFSSYSKVEGLLGYNAQAVLEDKNGNLWFATWGGVSKYDGKYFTQFTLREGLVSGDINDMLEDKEGNIWFATTGGLSKYDGRTFTNYTEKEGLAFNMAYTLIQDIEGNIWAGTSGGGVSKYDGKYFTNYTEKEGLGSDIVNDIIQDKSGNIWFGTIGGGIVKYDAVSKLKTGKESFVHYTEKEGLLSNNVTSIMEDHNKDLWISTDNGVSKLNLSSKSIKGGGCFFNLTKQEGLPSDFVRDIFEDRIGNLWFATNRGISKYNGKLFTNYSEGEGLIDSMVSRILQDKNGNIWCVTTRCVSKYGGSVFANFTEKEGVSKQPIYNITMDKDGNIWFGTEKKGVSKFNPSAEHKVGEANLINYTEEQGIPNNWVEAILEDKRGNMWFGSRGGLIKLNFTEKQDRESQFFTYLTDKDGLSSNNITKLFEDSKGNIWFGSYGHGIYKYDGNIIDALEEGSNISIEVMRDLKKVNNSFVKTLTHYTTKQGLSSNKIACIFEDRKGNIWFGNYSDGITMYDPKGIDKTGKDLFIHYTKKNGLPDDRITSILEDKTGNIWIGTYGGGICRYDGKYFTHFTAKNALSSLQISSILEDKKGNLWFLTRSSISKLSEKLLSISNNTTTYNKNIDALKEDDLLFVNYRYEDGYTGVLHSESNICEDKNGTIWIGTSDKLIAFHPEAGSIDSMAPNTQLTGLRLYNEDISWSTIQNKKDSILILRNGIDVSGFEFEGVTKWYSIPQNLSLSYNNNYLTFNFIGIIQKQNKKVKYKYFLEGNDVNWSATTSKNEATYGNLSPGTYTFKVKAMNGEGYWSNENSYTFTIRPPWWKTWWAYLLYTIVGLGILYWMYLLRTRSLRQTQILLEKKVEERTQELISAQAQLVQSEKMAAFGAVATRVAHEIQNPLNFVSNFSQLSEELLEDITLAKNDNEKEETSKLLLDNLQKINHHAKRADSIVKQLFEHTKAGTAHQYFEDEK